MHNYQIIIYGSDEDDIIVVEAPELPGCVTHDELQEEAPEQVNQAVDLWLETAREFGGPVPESKGERLTPS